MAKPKQSPWEITVGRKAAILASFIVPAHRFQRGAINDFLRAVVVRYRTDTPEEMAAFYVSKHKGTPDRLPFAEIRYSHDFERHRVGWCCGDWECYATAMQEIPADIAEAMQREIERTRRAQEGPSG